MCNGSAAEADVLRTLNLQMHAEEKRGADGLGFLRELLDPTLRFRRANGVVVTREEYLINLANPENRREKIEPVGTIDCLVYENTSIASMLLRVTGSDAGAPFGGGVSQRSSLPQEQAGPTVAADDVVQRQGA